GLAKNSFPALVGQELPGPTRPHPNIASSNPQKKELRTMIKITSIRTSDPSASLPPTVFEPETRKWDKMGRFCPVLTCSIVAALTDGRSVSDGRCHSPKHRLPRIPPLLPK